MTTSTEQLDRAVRNFVAELQQLFRHDALERAQANLGGARPETPARRGPGRPRKTPAVAAPAAKLASRPARKGGKRPPALLAKTVDALHAHIKSHPGERIEQIGKHLGLKTKDLALPVHKLLAAKKISKKGVKRSTTYFPKG